MAGKDTYDETSRIVLEELKASLGSIRSEDIERLIEAAENAEQIFFVGVGRVLLSLEAVAKRWAHLGLRTHIVGEITEPAITDRDILIVGSGSGTTLFPAGIARKAYETGAKVIHIGSNPDSELKNIADFMVRIPVRTKCCLEDEIDSRQPMTTLFEQTLLLVGDIAAKMMIDRRRLDMKELWRYHANLE